MGVATGALTVVLSSSVGSDFIDAHPPAGPLFCIKDVPFTPALLSPWMICVGLCCVHCCVLSYLLLPSVTFPW